MCLTSHPDLPFTLLWEAETGLAEEKEAVDRIGHFVV